MRHELEPAESLPELPLDPMLGVLLGQCIRYDVATVFDPAYTVVAKLEKRLLA